MEACASLAKGVVAARHPAMDHVAARDPANPLISVGPARVVASDTRSPTTTTAVVGTQAATMEAGGFARSGRGEAPASPACAQMQLVKRQKICLLRVGALCRRLDKAESALESKKRARRGDGPARRAPVRLDLYKCERFLSPVAEAAKSARERYLKHGFVVISGHLDPATVRGLLSCVASLESSVRAVKSPFKSQTKGSASELIESAHGVVGFGSGGGAPLQQIGHLLHGRVAAVRDVCRGAAVRSLCRALGLDSPRVVQSKFVLKPPRVGWRVPVHSDEQFIFTNPLSGFGLWWALDECTLENGCLEVIPGSHRQYAMVQRFECNHKERTTRFALFECARGEARIPWTRKTERASRALWVPLRMAPGDLVVLHPHLLHASGANRSGLRRRALTIHLVDANLPWDPRNWIQPRQDGNDFAPLPVEVSPAESHGALRPVQAG